MQSNNSEAYAVEKQIGKGAYGVAYIAKHKVWYRGRVFANCYAGIKDSNNMLSQNKGTKFVLKKVKLARQSHKERQASLKELLILSNLWHRNVLKFVDAWVEAGCVSCMVVELCESGDLLSQLKLRVPHQMYFHEAHLHQMLVQVSLWE
jgi:NIMA (never in mitosis gene a)-related kinase